MTKTNTSNSCVLVKNTKNRWALYSKNSFKRTGMVNPIGSFTTREVARLNKTHTQGIYDTYTGKFVR